MSKVVVAGGTGFIGKALSARLLSIGYEVVVLTRSSAGPKKIPPGARLVHWDPPGGGGWSEELDGAAAVVNLAGESIGARRWSVEQKRLIIRSRIDATSAIVTALGNVRQQPPVLLNASAIGYYGDTGDREITEDSEKGTGFLADTVEMWEAEARKVGRLGIRLVLMRSGVVLGRGATVLQRMVLPFRFFAGGPLGSGRQWFPWIHIDDLIESLLFTATSAHASGVYNAVGPQPVTMKQFSAVLGRVLHRPSWAPVPALVLRIVLGEMSGMVLGGQKALPLRLTREGFRFRYPTIDEALNAILGDRTG